MSDRQQQRGSAISISDFQSRLNSLTMTLPPGVSKEKFTAVSLAASMQPPAEVAGREKTSRYTGLPCAPI